MIVQYTKAFDLRNALFNRLIAFICRLTLYLFVINYWVKPNRNKNEQRMSQETIGGGVDSSYSFFCF